MCQKIRLASVAPHSRAARGETPRSPRERLRLADHVVEFEGTRGAYLAMDAGSGEHGGSLATSWHLVYDVRTETDMREVVALARDRGAGLLFVTDGVMPNPWDRLPAYWHQQVSLIGGID